MLIMTATILEFIAASLFRIHEITPAIQTRPIPGFGALN
jgi:hypothetical protein